MYTRLAVVLLSSLAVVGCATPVVPLEDASAPTDGSSRDARTDDARLADDASAEPDAAADDASAVDASAIDAAMADAAMADACAIDLDSDGDPSPACGGGDCDDEDPTRSSLLPEVCGAPEVDEDCDGDVDEEAAVALHDDLDRDGFGSAGSTMMGCPSVGLVADGTDCDDTRADVSPGASELCDNVRDDDCDLAVDEASPETFYLDADGDGFGVASATVTAASCTPPSGYAANAADCDDARAASFPGNATDPCNGLDDSCSNGVAGGGVDAVEDADGDRHGRPGTCGGGSGWPADDCDDTASAVHPGATEICDRLDTDCSSGGGALVSEDSDADGFAPSSATCRGGFPTTDCNDREGTVHPGAPEICNRVDDDCSVRFGTGEPTEDIDNDGHAPPTATCSGGFARDDCNDSAATTYLGAPELCDAVDQNCSNPGGSGPPPGGVDRREDADMDRHAPADAACMGGWPKDDCDDANAAFYPGAPLRGPRIIRPAHTAYTAPGERRPTFEWAPTGDGCLTAPYYEIAIDDSCYDAIVCSFSMMSPEVRETTIRTTTYTPTVDLPAGRRSWYHVRECTGPGTGCGEWSVIRYVEVGRAMHDLNGDGYSDFAVGAPDYRGSSLQSGRVYVYYGTASGAPSVASVRIETPFNPHTSDTRFGRTLAIGDMTGDGIADLVVGSVTDVYLFRGSTTGVATEPSSSWGSYMTDYARSIAMIGDVQADGYEDLAVGWTTASESGVDIYYGDASGFSSSDVRLDDPDRFTDDAADFGVSVGAAGDINGDGYDDLVVGAPGRDAPTTDEGYAYVFPGGPYDLGTTPIARIDSPSGEPGARFGSSVTGADLNRDGFGDVIVGAPRHDGAATDAGRVLVFHGARLGLPSVPSLSIDEPTSQANAHFGAVLAVGDVVGDDFVDLLVGAPDRDTSSVDSGSAFVLAGSATSLATTPASTLVDTSGTSRGLGSSIAVLGDVDRDGLDDVSIGAPLTSNPESAEGNVLVWLGGTFSSGPSIVIDDPTDRASAHFGTALASSERGRRREERVERRERCVGITSREREEELG